MLNEEEIENENEEEAGEKRGKHSSISFYY